MSDETFTLPRILYAIEVQHPIKGWVRMRTRYSSKDCAKGWRSFVKKAWGGLPTRVVKVEQ